MKIQVQIKNVYGNETIYPICATSKLLAALAKQKTFTNREINLLKDLGYVIEVVTDQPRSL